MFRYFARNDQRDAESRWLLLLAAIASIFLLLSGCGGGSDGGGTGGGGAGYNDPPDDDDDDDDPTDTTPPDPTLSSIQEKVFTPICTECHTGASAPQGLRLEEGMSYGMLVDQPSTWDPGIDRVEPGDPDNSFLIQKLEGTAAQGERMPLGGPYLSADTIAAIRQWITDGGQDNKTSPSSKPAMLEAGWPVADSSMAEAPQKILLMADAELDTTLINANSVQLLKLHESGDVETADVVTGVTFQVTSLAPTVIRLGVSEENALQPGRYVIRVKGSGASPLADRSGRLIDGNADGVAGGDFIARFEVEGTQ